MVYLVGESMSKVGISVVHAKGDADCQIVQEALKSAADCETHVVGEDTDLLVLLLFHVKENMSSVYFSSSRAGTTRVWDIQRTQSHLGSDVCNYILFAHAFSGCDTTSRTFGIGKQVPLKKIQQGNNLFLSAAKTFLQSFDHDTVAEAGEGILVRMYKGSDGDDLDQLRLLRYHDKMATSIKQVQPKTLPPTLAAARQHSFRVYYQVQEWKCLGIAFGLNALEWGFQQQRGQLHPVPTELPPAPDELLKIIKCWCTVSDCSSKGRCTC